MARTEHGIAFINMIAPSVVECCKTHGWGVPSAIIAQAVSESVKSTGISGLASSCYNYWGMKYNSKYGCGYKEYKTQEQRADGSYYTVTSKFCKANSVREGIELYFKFIEMNPRYKRVMASKTYTEYATMLKECGWATSLKYTQTIINNVLLYNTTIYDNGNIPIPQPTPKTEFSYIIGKTYTLDANLYIRLTPNGDKMEMYSLTTNAQLNAYTDDEGYCILRKGTRVTCKEIKVVDNSTWMRIPSGWICAKMDTRTYII